MPISTDIFDSLGFVNELQKKYYEDEDENTLMIGTYGAQAEVAGTLLQKALIVASETSNEAIPIKAKYEKNIISHAKFMGIEDINAIPAHMNVTLFIPRKQIDNNLYQNKFTLDKSCPLMIEDFEFHIDYNIIVTRNRIRTNEYVYTAIYDMERKNPLSDIDSPNLPPIGIFNTASGEMLGIACVIRQVQYITKYNKILTDNIIENKTMVFEFEDQLASFDVDAAEGTTKYHLNPVYDGTIISPKEKYCEYQFIESNSIRIKFNRDSYMPRMNADITINIKTTKGSSGIFQYTEDIITDLKSEQFGYSGIHCMIKPLTDSTGGIDRKTVSELKAMIPKEALSRGSIISTTDLDAFFNSTNLENSKIYFYKKKYNQLEHVYYSYLLMKYNNIIVPTNTIDIEVKEEELESNGKNWLIKPLTTFVYDKSIGVINNNITESKDNPFVYMNPFMIGINKTPLVLSYFLTIFNVEKYLEFSYINQTSILQFVASTVNVSRSGYSNMDKYRLRISMKQNISDDFNLIVRNDDKEIVECNIKVFLLLYSQTNSNDVWRYTEASIINEDRYLYDFEFNMTTDDTISANNLIKITDLKQPETGKVVDSYVVNGIKADVLIMAKTETYYGNDGFSNIIPGIDGYSICNRYSIRGGIDLFYNYTQMMNSTPIVKKNKDTGNYIFTINKVPMIRKSYISDEFRMKSIIKEIQTRRNYIEYCLNILEDGFDIDFKFFNTYGPSKRYTHEDETCIDRVNLSLRFKTKLYSNADKFIISMIKDNIKTRIETIDNITDIHMTNIADEIREKYKDQLQFFEFVGFNGYGPGYSHIYQVADEIKENVPEFLNINTIGGDSPDIEIIVN